MELLLSKEELGKYTDVMTIEGGLLSGNVRYLNGEPPKGRKVVYMGINGTEGSREIANMFLKVGQVLEVEEVYVHSSFSEVEFTSLPNEFFNTVMFAEYTGE